MNIELLESIKKIGADKELLNKLENSNCSLEDIYYLCKEHGFTGSYDVFEKDYEELFTSSISEIHEDELSSISGGKMNKFFSRSTAALLSALTLSTASMPSSSAINLTPKNPVNKCIDYIKKNPIKSLGIITLASVASGVTTYAITSAITDTIKENRLNKATEGMNVTLVGDDNLEKFINDLGTVACPYPKDVKSLSDHFVNIYTVNSPHANKYLLKYIYKIYNLANINMETIAKGLDLAANHTLLDCPARLNPAKLILRNFAEIVNFIKTTNRIPDSMRKEKFNMVLSQLEKEDLKPLEKCFINTSLFGFLVEKSDSNKNIFSEAYEFDIRKEEDEKIDIENILENFKKSGIIINELDKNEKPVASYPLSDLDTSHSKHDDSSTRSVFFSIKKKKSPPHVGTRFDFPKDKGWSVFNNIAGHDAIYINKGLGLVAGTVSNRMQLYTAKYIKGIICNSNKNKEIISILNEMDK